MPELSIFQWIIIGACAVMAGVSKTGVPGLAILIVPLMADAFEAGSSVGIVLGIFILADVFAAVYHHRNAQWSHVFRLLPIAFVGIVTGYFAMQVVDNRQLRPIIGVIVFLMLVINWWRTKSGDNELSVPHKWWLAIILGFSAGAATMMANAAGPIMVLYFLVMGLEKKEFVGTTAWLFFVINWIKVPFLSNLELMTVESVKLNLMMLPLIAIGAFLGVVILKRIPQKVFLNVVQILAAAAAVKLLF